MRYVLILTEDDGTVRTFGTPSGQPFASLEAAKDGRDRLMAWTGYSMQQIFTRPIESVPNLRGPQ